VPRSPPVLLLEVVVVVAPVAALGLTVFLSPIKPAGSSVFKIVGKREFGEMLCMIVPP
jgi:hypothetical protein